MSAGPKEFQKNITIVGAGPVGLALASWLHRNGHHVNILETRISPITGECTNTAPTYNAIREHGFCIRQSGLRPLEYPSDKLTERGLGITYTPEGLPPQDYVVFCVPGHAVTAEFLEAVLLPMREDNPDLVTVMAQNGIHNQFLKGIKGYENVHFSFDPDDEVSKILGLDRTLICTPDAIVVDKLMPGEDNATCVEVRFNRTPEQRSWITFGELGTSTGLAEKFAACFTPTGKNANILEDGGSVTGQIEGHASQNIRRDILAKLMVNIAFNLTGALFFYSMRECVLDKDVALPLAVMLMHELQTVAHFLDAEGGSYDQLYQPDQVVQRIYGNGYNYTSMANHARHGKQIEWQNIGQAVIELAQIAEQFINPDQVDIPLPALTLVYAFLPRIADISRRWHAAHQTTEIWPVNPDDFGVFYNYARGTVHGVLKTIPEIQDALSSIPPYPEQLGNGEEKKYLAAVAQAVRVIFNWLDDHAHEITLPIEELQIGIPALAAQNERHLGLAANGVGTILFNGAAPPPVNARAANG